MKKPSVVNRRFLTIISITLGSLLLSIILLRSCFSTNETIQGIYLVPKDAVFFLETEKPIQNWKKISESEVWKHLNTNNYFSELTENLHTLDTIFKERQGFFKFIGDRNVIVSAHVYTSKDYSFLYLIDLEEISNLNILKSNIKSLVGNDFKVTSRTYKTHTITELYNTKNRETLYVSFVKNQVLVSFVHSLVEASIDEYLVPSIGRDFDFIATKKEVGYTDMFQLYIQHRFIKDYMNVYSSKESSIVKDISSQFTFSGFSFNLHKNTIAARGLTVTSPEANSYIRAMLQSGSGKRTFQRVVPQHSAAIFHLAFDNFEDFYENVENIQKENLGEFNSYLKNKDKVEGFLDINFKKHIASWIDNEIAFIQLHSSVSNTKDDIALLIKASNNTSAKENLAYISSQIRKKTPVKFKAINYKGYQINYLSMKGFFNVFLGKLFDTFEKPYYTIIDDYVLFSNRPNTLKSIINNYIDKTTLSNNPHYLDFEKKLNTEASMFIYIHTPNLYDTFYTFLNANTKNNLKDTKDYITSFEYMGLQLTPQNTYYKSNIVIEYTTSKANIARSTDTLTKIEHQEKEEDIFKVPEIFPSDLTADEYTFINSKGEKCFTVELKDGVPDGSYNSYYKNGVIKIKGKFNKGKQISTWRAYDNKGNRLAKKKF